ncbi:MAG: UDP-N-acetylmuramoyl-L-alanyl-D-glutamate--2,6-diaminopimelate ligase [Oscillospiraceae bacterium]|jgi:UDP-N-acetylmuramoyl-L-alanyl-D-glutamate--2,6-diaminopimelate ligase|nr:UDP-N-acetylmuramoyl-L-alanyl-D-glutamate--2,6-diaminopimelate ligase [Oscillospiraceae bacterium]
MKLFDMEVSGVTDNTNEFTSGNVFVCIKGENFDGHDAAKEMLEKGAVAIVTERDLGLEKQIIVPNTRKELAKLASEFYGNPTKKLKLIAATGTNGKSTVIALIKHILEMQGHKTASIGTVGYDVVGKIYEAKLTVPRQTELYKLFREAADNGAEYCVIEASSQALAQDRFGEEVFECAVFTNLTQDHLDWHGTMENYFHAKRALFGMTKSAIVCIDDKYGEKLVKYINTEYDIPVITYSAKGFADNYAVNIKSSGNGVSYWFSSAKEEKSFPLKLAMPGLYNVANSIAAIAACAELGIDLSDAVRALSGFKGVRGRSEIIHSGEFTIICDYAHTEDALKKFLTSVREFTAGRLICVFGAPGERDIAKRPLMGEAVDRHADYIVITSDNPRFEDRNAIIEQVAAGIKNTPYEAFADRKEAIHAAIKQAQKGDMIALCGKGHETYQAVGGKDLPFDEREIVREFLKS